MGKQTQVVMADEDEAEFLLYLSSVASIHLFENFAPSPDLLRVEHFGAREQGHWQYFIWNTAFQWSPRLERVKPGAPHRAGWSYHGNTSTAPLIEYDRHNFESGGVQGRLYWAKHFASSDPLSYDEQAFSKWYGQVVRWVRKRGKRQTPRAHEPYFLPVAWARHAGAR